MDWHSDRSEDVANKLSQLYNLSPTRVKQSAIFQALANDPGISKSALLASIPTLPTRSYRPLHVLTLLLANVPGRWPLSALLYHFTRLQRNHLESPQASHREDATWLVQSIGGLAKSITALSGQPDTPASRSTKDGGTAITHNKPSDNSSQLPSPDSKQPIVLFLPDEPLLAAVWLQVANCYIAVLIDPEEDSHQLRAGHDDASACHTERTRILQEKLSAMQQTPENLKVDVILVNSEDCKDIIMRDIEGHTYDFTAGGELASLISGDAVICSMVGAHVFWDVVDKAKPSWYLASASMHARQTNGLTVLEFNDLIRDAFSCKVTNILQSMESNPNLVDRSRPQGPRNFSERALTSSRPLAVRRLLTEPAPMSTGSSALPTSRELVHRGASSRSSRERTRPTRGTFIGSVGEYQCELHLDANASIAEATAHFAEKSRRSGPKVFLAPKPPGATSPAFERTKSLVDESISPKTSVELPGIPHTEKSSVSTYVESDDEVDEAKVAATRAEVRKDSRLKPNRKPSQDIQRRVRQAFSNALHCDAEDVDVQASFFEDLGGDTKKAGELLSALGADFNIHLPFSLLAKEASVEGISAFIETYNRKEQSTDATNKCNEKYSSTRVWLLILQLFPIVVLYPAQGCLELILQLYILSKTRGWGHTATLHGRVGNLVLSLVSSWAICQTLYPFIGMLAKWSIIGRYREGTYPMWGQYHTRWWIVQKIVMLCGKGIFELNDSTRNIYCRLMGAKIGKNVLITDVPLGEWDLLDIRDGAVLTKCQCRPFAAEQDTSMYLGRIVIGERSSIGLLSVVAPGTEVLPDSQMGANSSSWEEKDLRANGQERDGSRINEPHWLLSLTLTLPMSFVSWTISFLPWFFATFPLIYSAPKSSTIPLRVIVESYQEAPQLAYTYLSVGSKTVFGPAISFFFAISIRYFFKMLFGALPTDPSDINGNFTSWRARIPKTLFPEAQMQELNELLGHHNEARSGALRWLGATVGKRIFWPNMGPAVGDYHLLNVGDDVTFGENCHLLTTDENSSGQITIDDGAIIADQVCVLPGVTIGKRAAIGFGTLTRRGQYYEHDQTYIGCKDGHIARSASFGEKLWGMESTPNQESTNEKGGSKAERRRKKETSSPPEACRVTSPARLEEGLSSRTGVHEKDEPRLRLGSAPPEESPYNRAMYMKDAPYHVLTPSAALCFSVFMTLFTAVYWNIPALSSIKIAAHLFTLWIKFVDNTYDVLILYALALASAIVLNAAFVFFAFGLIVLAKRMLIGKHKEGVYDWDKSPYCQRRQILISIEKLTRRCFIDKGILSLLTGTHWIVLYYRALGATIGKDCALFANGYPSLMLTEPDLIEIGDRVTICNASIVSSIDRRGSVRLARIKIGNGCVLRSGSQILCGAEMKEGSCLLEHTLILPDEVIGRNWTMHRRPAERFYGPRMTSQPRTLQ